MFKFLKKYKKQEKIKEIEENTELNIQQKIKEKEEAEELERIERIIEMQKKKIEEEKKLKHKEQERIKKEQEKIKEKEEKFKKEKEKQERLKKEEEIRALQEKKRLLEKEIEEKKIKKDKLINEIRENYISISKGIDNIMDRFYEESEIKNVISEDKELFKRFGDIVLDIYCITDNITNYKDFTEKVFGYSFIEKMSKKYLSELEYKNIMINYKNAVYNFKGEYDFIEIEDNEYNYLLRDFLEGSEGGFSDIFATLQFYYSDCEDINSIVLELIIEKEKFSSEEIFELEEKNIDLYSTHNTSFYTEHYYWRDEFKNISYFIRQLFYAYLFVYYIIYLRKVKEFIKNKELLCILKNIKNETNDIDKILFKFYSIYSNCYKDSFKYELTINEILILILAVGNKEKYESFIKYKYYENLINEFKSDKNLKKMLDSIDKDIFMKYHSINDFSIINDQTYFYNELFDYIVSNIINYLDNDEILDIIFQKNIYINRLKKNDKLKEALVEKNKYLYGTVKKEKINKLDINNVTSGEDFEKFLKEVFSRLGYQVALTQQTRDQGADLILQKELVKIVVQAKFYSSSVGNKAVQEVIASKSFYNADSCMVVTNNTFTSAALELAQVNNVKLIDGKELNNMIKIANLLSD